MAPSRAPTSRCFRLGQGLGVEYLSDSFRVATQPDSRHRFAAGGCRPKLRNRRPFLAWLLVCVAAVAAWSSTASLLAWVTPPRQPVVRFSPGDLGSTVVASRAPQRQIIGALLAHDSGREASIEASTAEGLGLEHLHLARDGSTVFAATTEADLDALRAAAAQRGQLLLVDYYAPWCRACIKLLSQLHKMAEQDAFQGVIFASVDFEKSRPLCRSRSLKKLPTLEIYHNGEVQQRWSGASKQTLLMNLNNAIQEFGNSDGGSGAAKNLALAAMR